MPRNVYSEIQEKHHAEGTTHDRLERIDRVDPPSDRPDTNSDGSRDEDEETR